MPQKFTFGKLPAQLRQEIEVLAENLMEELDNRLLDTTEDWIYSDAGLQVFDPPDIGEELPDDEVERLNELQAVLVIMVLDRMKEYASSWL